MNVTSIRPLLMKKNKNSANLKLVADDSYIGYYRRISEMRFVNWPMTLEYAINNEKIRTMHIAVYRSVIWCYDLNCETCTERTRVR